MEQSFFLKCEKCTQKPATIKLSSGLQEKKLCFQCERELLKEPFYQDWTKQFIPYSDLKRNSHETKVDHSRQINSSKIDRVLRSPHSTTPSTSRVFSNTHGREKNEKLSESYVLKSPVGHLDSIQTSKSQYLDISAVSPRVGIGKKSYDITKPLTETKNTTGQIRQNTPKKPVYLSEYLKDFDPRSVDFKSPTGRALKRDILNKTSGAITGTSFTKPLTSVEINKFDRTRFTTPNEPQKINIVSERKQSPVHERYKSFESKQTNLSTETYNRNLTPNEPDRKARDVRKEEIRNRITKLSEQFSSPPRSPPRSIANGNTSVIEHKTSRTNLRSTPQYESFNKSPNRGSVDNEIKSRTRNESGIDDTKYKLTVEGYENNVASLKDHIESIEKRNAEVVHRLKEELKQVKDELFKEKTENTSRNNKEISTLNSKHNQVNDLERSLHQEAAKNRLLEDKLEQNRTASDKRSTDTKEELERVRKDKDRRIEELNNQLKTQVKTHRDTIENLQQDNDSFVKKLKGEYELIIKDLTKQLEFKTQDVERLKQEKEESIVNFNGKIATLQESVRYHQDANNKLRQNLDVRNSEDLGNQRLSASGRSGYGTRNEYTTPIKDNI